jgi:hypothetical protein
MDAVAAAGSCVGSDPAASRAPPPGGASLVLEHHLDAGLGAAFVIGTASHAVLATGAALPGAWTTPVGAPIDGRKPRTRG